MIKVRNNVFETNSSSMHSFAYRCLNKDNTRYTKEEAIAELISNGAVYDSKSNTIDLTGIGELDYGWGPETYIDFTNKFIYVLETLYNGSDESTDSEFSDFNMFVNCITEFLEIEKFIYPGNGTEWKSGSYSFASIDHQSFGDILRDIRDSEYNLVDFCLDRKFVLIIDNDNH